MAFIFPDDKNDFTAPNGVTYHWDGTKWVTKTFKADESALEDYATEQWTEEKIAEAMLDGTVALDSYATIEYSDTEDAKLQNQIDELGVTKGALSTYACAAISLPAQPRNGECIFNDATASSALVVGFGAEDKDGQLTKPILNGDIIEIEKDGIVSRYRVLDNASAPSMVACEFVSGDQTFAVGQEYVVYIYPQNEAGASKEYVDAQDALLQGQIDNKVNTDDIEDKFIEKDGDEFGADKYLKFPGGGIQFSSIADSDSRKSFLYNASDSVTQWSAYNGSSIKVTARDGDPGGGRTFIDIQNADSGGEEGADGGYRMKLYHVATPTADYQAANRKYVDEAIAAISPPADGGGAAGIVLNLWTYRGQKNSSSGLNDGEFGSKKMANGVLELYLAGKNSQGWFYHPTRPNSTAEYDHQITNSQPGSPMTVTDKYGRGLWYAETKKIVFNKGGSSGVMVEAIKYRAQYDNLVDGDQYILNVAGFLSPVLGWS